MTALRTSLVAALASILTFAAQAGDAAALRVIGFSPDGAVFAFEQYTMLYEDEAAFSEYVFIDTRADRLIGAPVKVLIRGDDGLDEGKARGDAEKRAAPLIRKHKIGETGTRFEGKPSIALDQIGIYQTADAPLAKTQEIALADGRKLRLAIAERALGEATCDGVGGRGTPGKVAVKGVTLTLAIDGAAPVTLQSDQRLPQSRRCVSGYGIAEAYTHTAPDKIVTLAVLLELVDNNGYHAGPNRRLMAVTKRLPGK